MAQIVIAGGGTGGHVYPALAIAESLNELGIDKEKILFLGSNHSVEKKVIPENGFILKTLPGKGLNRREVLKNIGHLFLILFSCFRVFILFIFFRPKVVVGVGGYASIPAITAASILRIPIFVHEQNAVVTRSNALAVKMGAKLLTAFQDTKGASQNSIYSGLPLRGDYELLLEKRREYLSQVSIQKSQGQWIPKVLIIGGSLGSVSINNCVIEMLKQKKERKFFVHHITGKNDYKRVSETYEKEKLDSVEVDEYRDDINDLIATSDLVISRAGASSCVQIQTIGTQSIFIPLPNSPGNHQYLNAVEVLKFGRGLILDQEKLTPLVLLETIEKQFNNDIKEHPNAFHLGAGHRIALLLIEKIGRHKP